MNIDINDINDNPRVGAMLDNNGSFTQYGITLLDHYAGLAMQGICVNAGRNKFDVDQADDIASYAYHIADAMLKARKENSNG